MIKDVNSKIGTFLLLVVLFFPVKFLYAYYLILILIVLFLTVFNRDKLKLSLSFKILFFIFLGVVFSSLIPVVVFGSSLSKNFTEILRFIPVLILLLNFNALNIDYRKVFYVFLLYTLISFVVNIIQFNNSANIQFIADIYSSELHINNSLSISNRSLGLSSGPGSNGSISVFMAIFFIVNYLFFDEFRKLSISLYVVSFFNILLSQSQTAFIAVILVSLVIVFYFSVKFITSVKFTRLIPFVLIISSGVLVVFYSYLDKLRYLYTLFELGLSRSSYEVREDKVNVVIEMIIQKPYFFVFGHGKEIVPYSSAMDNEYIFILSVYGLFTLILFVAWYIYSIWFIFLFSNIYAKLVTFTLLCGLILAWPSSFILDPRLMFIFVLYIVLCLNKHYSCKKGI